MLTDQKSKMFYNFQIRTSVRDEGWKREVQDLSVLCSIFHKKKRGPNLTQRLRPKASPQEPNLKLALHVRRHALVLIVHIQLLVPIVDLCFWIWHRSTCGRFHSHERREVKNIQIQRKYSEKMAALLVNREVGRRQLEPGRLPVARPEMIPNQSSRALIIRQTCRGSFPVLSKPIFASKYLVNTHVAAFF